jgi:hypothetical protein
MVRPMLRFASKPDHLFVLLLDEALAQAIVDLTLGDSSEQQDVLAALMPTSAKLFDVAGVTAQLRVLTDALAKTELYQPTDYHWLLLYEVLDAYCLQFNDVACGPVFSRYGIEHIEFDYLVDVFFWDTDFLDVHIPDLSLEAREAMDVSPETFGLTSGMKPHPEELQLELCDDELAKDFHEDPCVMYVSGSREYPSLSEEHPS